MIKNQGNTFSMLTEILGPTDSNRLREMSKPLTTTATTDIKDLPGNKNNFQEKSSKYNPLDEISVDLDLSVFDSIGVSSFDEMDCFDIDINELIYCDQNSNSSSQGHGPKSNGSTGTTSDSAIGSVSQPLTPASMHRIQTQTPENVYCNPYSNQPSSAAPSSLPPTISSPHKNLPPPTIPQTREQKLQQLESMSKLLDQTNKNKPSQNQGPVNNPPQNRNIQPPHNTQSPIRQPYTQSMPSPAQPQASPRFVSPNPNPQPSPGQMIRPQMMGYPQMHPSDPRYRQYMMQMQQYAMMQHQQRAMMMQQMHRQQYAQGMRPGMPMQQHPHQMMQPGPMSSPRSGPSPHVAVPSPGRPMSRTMQAPSPMMTQGQGQSTVAWGKPQ